MPKHEDEVDDPLGPFEVTLFEKEYTLNPREDLQIEIESLGDCLTTQPTMFGYYSVVSDMAANVVDALQVALQQKESELYAQLEEELGKTPSEDKSKKYIRGHSEYHAIQEDLVNANFLASKMRSLVNAFVDRRFCLLGLSGKQSNQMFHEGAITIKQPNPVAVSEHRKIGAFPGKKAR